MKIVFNYTVMHTGTRFVENLINKACNYNSKRIGYMEDSAARQVLGTQRIEDCSFLDFTNETEVRFWLKTKTINDNNADLFVIQGHHLSESFLWRTLKRKTSTVKFVVPMRDPLLSLNTRIRRNTYTVEALHNKTRDERVSLAKAHIDCIDRMLSLPEKNVMYFPIDTDTDRAMQAKRLFEYTNIPYNENKLSMLAKKWEPENKTPTLAPDDSTIRNFKRPSKDDRATYDNDIRFEELKEHIKNKNIKEIKNAIGIEFEYLKKNYQHLVPKLKQLGYKDFCWEEK